MILGIPAWIWYAGIGIIVGFLCIIVFTFMEGPPKDEGDIVFAFVMGAVLWPIALGIVFAYSFGKYGVALGLRLRNKYGSPVQPD